MRKKWVISLTSSEVFKHVFYITKKKKTNSNLLSVKKKILNLGEKQFCLMEMKEMVLSSDTNNGKLKQEAHFFNRLKIFKHKEKNIEKNTIKITDEEMKFRFKSRYRLRKLVT